MDYESEITNIKDSLKEHSARLTRHRNEINQIKDSISHEDKRLGAIETKMDSMEKNLSNLNKDVEAIRNQNTLTVTEVRSIKKWQKITLAAIGIIVVSIFIAGGEFKQALIQAIVQAIPGAIKIL